MRRLKTEGKLKHEWPKKRLHGPEAMKQKERDPHPTKRGPGRVSPNRGAFGRGTP